MRIRVTLHGWSRATVRFEPNLLERWLLGERETSSMVTRHDYGTSYAWHWAMSGALVGERIARVLDLETLRRARSVAEARR